MKKDLFEPNPFANPILAESGNLDERELYTAVGYCLDRWERSEISFCVLYSSLINPPDGNHVLLRSFGTIMASSTRREMILEACDAFFGSSWRQNDELKAHTRKLLNLYKSASARRNEIAHGVVNGAPQWRFDDDKAVPLPTIWFVEPSLFSTRKQDLPIGNPKYRYSTTEIYHFALCFEELSRRAMDLSKKVREFWKSSNEKP